MAFDCVVIGDEIALNVAAPLACEVRAASGITSSHTVERAAGKFHVYCVVSAGTNDPTSSKLASNLTMIRNQSSCKVYVWLVPANVSAAAVVTSVANKFYDKTVAVIPGPDGVHPSNYNTLAGSILSATGN